MTYYKILYGNPNDYKNYCSKVIFFLTKELDYNLKLFVNNKEIQEDKSQDMTFFMNIILDIINLSIYYIYYSNYIMDLLNYRSSDNNPKFIKDYSFFKDLIDTLLILYPNIVIQTFKINNFYDSNQTITKNLNNNDDNNDNNDNNSESKININGHNDNNNKNDKKDKESESGSTSKERSNLLLIHFNYQDEKDNDKKKKKEIVFKIRYKFRWQSIYNVQQIFEPSNNFYNDINVFYLFCFIFNSEMMNKVLSINHQKYDKKTTKLFIDRLVQNYIYLIQNYSNYQDTCDAEKNIGDISLFESSPLEDMSIYQSSVISFQELFNDFNGVESKPLSNYKITPLINIPEKSIINITNILVKWMEYFELKCKERNKDGEKNKENDNTNKKESNNKNDSDPEFDLNFDFDLDIDINATILSEADPKVKDIKRLLKPLKIKFEIFKLYTSNNIEFMKKLVQWFNDIDNKNLLDNEMIEKCQKEEKYKNINDSFYGINIDNLKSSLIK